eukprot:scaffold766_cov560-Prasinococcus_capsulatus_cf.AAC.2
MYAGLPGLGPLAVRYRGAFRGRFLSPLNLALYLVPISAQLTLTRSRDRDPAAATAVTIASGSRPRQNSHWSRGVGGGCGAAGGVSKGVACARPGAQRVRTGCKGMSGAALATCPRAAPTFEELRVCAVPSVRGAFACQAPAREETTT